MPRRPAVRKSDLSATLDVLMAQGMRPRSIRYHADGGFTFSMDDRPAAANDDGLDAELAAFEAQHGKD